ncbi:MAG: stage II sporulation protein P [Eubacteriales bacterium]
MLKNIGSKIYFFIICVLIFSVIYQASFLILNAKDLNVFDLFVTKEESAQEKNNENESADFAENDIFLSVLKMGIPHNQDKISITSNVQMMVRYFTNIDIYDPKTLISSQMPLIENYEHDNVEITPEEEQEIYSITTSKPLNDDKVSESSEIGEEPLVLIYHTHTTESFTSSDKIKIDYSSYCRSRKEEYNMVAVGKVVANVIEEKYGIKVVHDVTVHDFPSYVESYSNSLKTIEKNLEKYPSIKYAFDLHRDGLAENVSNKKKYAAVVNNVACAKIMMVVGLNHKNANVNVQFAEEVYKKMNTMYPGIALQTIKRSTAKYNQFVRDYAMLFEVGSNLSTLEEAKASGNYLGDVLGKVITEKESN